MHCRVAVLVDVCFIWGIRSSPFDWKPHICFINHQRSGGISKRAIEWVATRCYNSANIACGPPVPPHDEYTYDSIAEFTSGVEDTVASCERCANCDSSKFNRQTLIQTLVVCINVNDECILLSCYSSRFAHHPECAYKETLTTLFNFVWTINLEVKRT